ncbi:MAG: methylmalonyl-CoA epimerase [Deltaproteobacteria bacterium]|nr:methylmalonyl-CoA epimerase [Deltaproteobacteria bacterium]MBW2118487.1 methylmalonyl-CoA epimerase [Deltaproteobacteria bacterium]MBW2343145.1 methylmalonyl-CoA epimerase [Deltaproteobacteria bacterium]MCD6296943.1 methylmalonyl-CoA epimerase [Deltaproteobacteria bacterium]
MFKKIDHIAIAVKDIESAILFFKERYGLETTSQDTVGDTKAAFLPIGDTRLELVQAVTPEGVIAKHIEKKGEGIHHIAFEVEDVGSSLEKVKSDGVACIDKVPRKGAHDSMVAFLHPNSNYGILVELVQHHKKE